MLSSPVSSYQLVAYVSLVVIVATTSQSILHIGALHSFLTSFSSVQTTQLSPVADVHVRVAFSVPATHTRLVGAVSVTHGQTF